MAKVTKREWTNRVGEKKIAYVVDYKDLSGVRRTPQFQRKHQADEFLRKVQHEIFGGVHVPKSQAITFAALGESWIKDCERRHGIGDRMSGNTLNLVVRMVRKHLVPAFGTTRASEITAKQVRDFVNTKAVNYKRKSVDKMVETMRFVLQFGVQEGHLKRNLLRDDPPRIPVEANARIQVPSLEDMKRLIQVIEAGRAAGGKLPGMTRRMRGNTFDKAALVVYLALTTGMRRGEICALRWEHVLFDKGRIEVRHSMSRYDGLKAPKSKAGLREVPLVPVTRLHLEAFWQTQGSPADGFVLTTDTGNSIWPGDVGEAYWKPIAKAAGMVRADGKFMGLHSLRHAAASMWIRGRVPDLALKRAIGHSSINYTKDIYGHMFADDEDAHQTMIASFLSATEPREAAQIAADM